MVIILKYMGGLDGITRVLISGRGRLKLRFRGDVTTEVSERQCCWLCRKAKEWWLLGAQKATEAIAGGF